MYKELDKYKTGKKVNATGILPDKQEIKIKQNGYEFGLGDLVNDYIEHKRTPWYKRKYYHGHLTKIYINTLNIVTIADSM